MGAAFDVLAVNIPSLAITECLCFVRLKQAINFGAPDNVPTKFLIVYMVDAQRAPELVEDYDISLPGTHMQSI